MSIFEVQGPDGKTYEVEAPSMEAAAEAIGSFGAMPAGGSSANKAGVDDFKNRLTVLGANAANTAGLGLGDEFTGMRAGIGSMLQGGDYLPAYQETRDKVRGDMATVNAEFPAMATTGKIAGAALPGLAISPLGTGKNVLETMFRSGGLGATEGALQGGGNADGRGIMGETIKGGLIGLGAGMAAPALVGMAARGKNFFTEDIPSMFGKESKGVANRAIADALVRSGKSVPDLDALLAASKAAGQPEYRLADALGLPGQRALNGITRAGGAPGDEVAEFLAARQLDQGDRVGSFIEDAFDVKGTTALKTKEGMIDARRIEDNANYAAAAANAAPVDVQSTVGMLDNTISKMADSGLAPTRVVDEFSKLRAKLAGVAPDGSPTTLSDYESVLDLWREVRDDVSKAYNSGNGALGEALKPIRDELKLALSQSSPDFLAANTASAASKGAIQAVDEGAAMATRGRAADTTSRYQSMPPASQGAARVGYGDKMLNYLERVTAPAANRAKALGSTKRVQEASAMATDAPLYSERLARENAMWETQNRALGGSRTADNLADQEAMNALAGGALDAAKSVGNFQFGDAVAKIAALLKPIAKGGQNTATRALIAKALLSGDPMTALAPAIAATGKSAAVRRAIEAAIRQPMREGGEALVQ